MSLVKFVCVCILPSDVASETECKIHSELPRRLGMVHFEI